MVQTIVWMIIMMSIFVGGFIYYASIAARSEQKKR